MNPACDREVIQSVVEGVSCFKLPAKRVYKVLGSLTLQHQLLWSLEALERKGRHGMRQGLSSAAAGEVLHPLGQRERLPSGICRQQG